MKSVYPWSAVVGQHALKRALVLTAIDPAIGGVLVQGPRGVAKTTLARALAELVPGQFVELPLGASEDRVTGTLDLGAALRDGSLAFAPGLLARAHDGVLYVDEVNLLPDALIDLLLDAAASGRNVVERDGISHEHAARFVLVGTMNPEEGELRPQLTDRFGLAVDADGVLAPAERAEIVARRLAFDADPGAFRARFANDQAALLARIASARAHVASISLTDALPQVSERCHAAGVEGVRADLAMLRAARAHAAWEGRDAVQTDDIEAVAELALAHRRTSGSQGGSGTPPAGGRSSGGRSAPPRSSSSSGFRTSAAASDRTNATDTSAHARTRDSSGVDPNAGDTNGVDARAGDAGSVDPSAGDAAGVDPSAGDAAGVDPSAGDEAGVGPSAGDAAGVDPSAGDASDPAGGTGRGVRRTASDDANALSRPVPDPHGALAALPVAAITPSQLPLWLTKPPRHGRSELRRRGRARTRAPRGARAHAHREGGVDWFATLVRNPRPLTPADLQHRARRAPPRALWVLALDCSSSMLRAGALAHAKGVAHALTARAHRAGAHVAIIDFRGDAATLASSPSEHRRTRDLRLQSLSASGTTPLRAALQRACALCEAPSFRAPDIDKRLLVLTDGRTRESVGDLAPAGATCILIDCERGQLRLGRTRQLSAQLRAHYVHVDDLR